jgi:hypothetical protein
LYISYYYSSENRNNSYSDCSIIKLKKGHRAGMMNGKNATIIVPDYEYLSDEWKQLSF